MPSLTYSAALNLQLLEIPHISLNNQHESPTYNLTMVSNNFIWE